MATTIKTSSKNYFNKIQKYLNNKRIFFTPSLNLGVYALTIFDLNQDQTNSLISKMTKHFHLTKQQESMVLDSVEFRHDSVIQANLTTFAIPSLAA